MQVKMAPVTLVSNISLQAETENILQFVSEAWRFFCGSYKGIGLSWSPEAGNSTIPPIYNVNVYDQVREPYSIIQRGFLPSYDR